ncbi:MAG: Mur ligase family protein [Pseudomonadota bacterium]|nr:Mur ligase family protein [Pseudomonadota bacterium]
MVIDDYFYEKFIKNPEKGTQRILNFLSKISHPQKKINNIIHVTGTNGKGSTIEFIRSCLNANKLTSNVFTSPHLLKVNERFIIQNKVIDDNLLSSVIENCNEFYSDQELSFFEFFTVCAFELFSKNLSDFNIFEVGIGGLHDPTNVMAKKDLSIITTISYDHEELLGNDLEMIACEKLGIIPEGGLAIFGPQDNSIKHLINKYLIEKNARGFFYEKDWFIERDNNSIIYRDEAGKLEFELLGLNGRFQIFNAGLCIASLRLLKRYNKIEIDDKTIITGLRSAKLNGRLSKLTGNTNSWITNDSEILIDGCHNPSAAKVIRHEMIEANINNKKNLLIILGLKKNKKLESFLVNFRDIAKEITIVPIKGSDSASLLDLKNINLFENTILKEASSLKEAINSYSKYQNSRILICGSLYLVSEALSID